MVPRQTVVAVAAGVALALQAGCAQIRTHRQLEQPVGATLTSGVGGTLFRLNKIGDLPNAFGGRDIWGGKVDKGFAEMRLAAIDAQILVLEIVDVNRQSSDTTMDRYKPFQRKAVISVDVQTSVVVGSEQPPASYRVNLDTAKQRDIVIAGVRVTFVEVQPYSVRYKLEDVQPR